MDRIHWNCATRRYSGRAARLSVSTSGSYSLKLLLSSKKVLLTRTFSIHKWIVFIETAVRRAMYVSTLYFQYPQVDRIHWNENKNGVTNLPARLSVSTSGSYSLKRYPVCADVGAGQTFSIHKWIVFIETSHAWIKPNSHASFQYPQVDRIHWNFIETTWTM